jgi:DNA-directed DNA polymerase III PolC
LPTRHSFTIRSMFLNCHSYFSLRYGTLSVELLVRLAKKKNIRHLALTDINNTSAFFDFARQCLAEGIQPVGGMEFREGDTLRYICLARSNEGFREINELRTLYNLSKAPLPEQAPDFKEVFVLYPFGEKDPATLRAHEFIGIRSSQLNKFLFSPFRAHLRKLVVLQPVTFATDRGYELHRNLRAIHHNTLISMLEPQHLAHPEETFVDPEVLRNRFEQFPELIQTAEWLLEQCLFEFNFKQVKNKKTFSATESDDRLLLEKLAFDGLKYRYGPNNKEALKRVQHELKIIDELHFSAYFLITWDLIRYSMSRGFYHVGRGSGANSIVAYCLKITDVCPIELNLHFERFLNPKRRSPPDFDIDYSWKDRDEVTDYLFKRYGREHTALLGTSTTFKDSSILRELGKVYGLPKQEIDQLVNSPETDPEGDSVTAKIHYFGKLIQDFPNYRSIHAGGILISEKPMTCYTALDMPPKGYLTTQWDMYLAEDIGFEKLDVLSQRGIGHIKEAVDLVRRNKHIEVDIHDVQKFKTDEGVRRQITSGETIGCFYVESPAMRGLLKKLRCDNYLSLVAASSIIRPGVARSGMMKQYIQRFHHPEKITYLHPILKEQLSETYGVMVYQEDVLKVGHHFAGLDLAEADVLRRMMSGKARTKKEFLLIVDKFFNNCKARGYSDELTKEVWRQIESFAGYSFSKAHSASYAVESYQSLYLKAHYPKEFMVAVINNFGGFYKTWVYVAEARKTGATIHLPCVNKSENTTTIYGDDIYLGFIHLANLEAGLITKLVGERVLNGEYRSLEDCIRRTGCALEQVVILIRIGAFRFTGIGKKPLLWEVYGLLGNGKKIQAGRELFSLPSKKYVMPHLEQLPEQDACDEIELLGFPVTLSYFDLLPPEQERGVAAKNLIQYLGKTIQILGLLIATKYVRTIRQEEMRFGTFFDCDSNFFDTVHFPPSLARSPFRGHGLYLITGTVVEEFGFASLEVQQMEKITYAIGKM